MAPRTKGLGPYKNLGITSGAGVPGPVVPKSASRPGPSPKHTKHKAWSALIGRLVKMHGARLPLIVGNIEHDVLAIMSRSGIEPDHLLNRPAPVTSYQEIYNQASEMEIEDIYTTLNEHFRGTSTATERVIKKTKQEIADVNRYDDDKNWGSW